jgi:hypothetical protein
VRQRLRLLVDVDADPATVDSLRVMVDHATPVAVNPRGPWPAMNGHLIGAVPVEGESVAAAAAELARHEAGLGGLEDE